MTLLDSLFVKLGFAVDAKGLENFAGLAEKAKGIMLGLSAAIMGAATGIGLMVKRSAEEMDDIGDFAETVGMSAREVEALGVVAMENDSSLQGMEGTIRSITVSTGQAAMGFGRAAMVFKKFGLQAKNADGTTKSFDQMLGDIAAKMQTLDLGRRNALGARLGIDPMLVKLLAHGKENFDALVEAARKENPFTEADYKTAGAADVAFKKTHHRIGVLRNQIAVALMPKVTALLDKFTKWMREESNVRKLTSAIDTMVSVLEFVWRNLKWIGLAFGVLIGYKIGAGFIAWADAAKKAAKELGTLGAAGGILKGLLTGGIIAAIVLVAEDLWTFYRGGESVTGLLLKKFPYAVETMKTALIVLAGALALVTSGNPAIAALVVTIGGIVVIAQEIRDAWNPLSQWWDELWDGMFNKVANIWNALPKPIRMMLGGLAGDWSGEEMSLDVFKKNEASRLNLAQFRAPTYKPWGVEETGSPSWLTPKSQRPAGNVTTNFGVVNFNLPNVTGGKEAAREANRELARLAHGGVGG